MESLWLELRCLILLMFDNALPFYKLRLRMTTKKVIKREGEKKRKIYLCVEILKLKCSAKQLAENSVPEAEASPRLRFES